MATFPQWIVGNATEKIFNSMSVANTVMMQCVACSIHYVSCTHCVVCVMYQYTCC